MTLACISTLLHLSVHSQSDHIHPALVIPAAYHSTMLASDGAKNKLPALFSAEADIDQGGLLVISRGTALLLLGVYVAYLCFQVR
jgi:Ca2+:H+ antiporter